MWIVPKTLSAFVPDTAGWSWALDEQAWMFAQSVTWRSKFMSKQYWLKRWKKGDYVQHLSGLTLNPSMHDHFVESWTESQEASHVSHFQVQENEKDKKTQGTYGQASQTLFDFADLDGSSSKTCQDWLPLGCVTSCKTWDKWVTERRGAYSARKKLALHTREKESSSLRGWATPMSGTKDHMGSSVEYYQRRQRIGKQVDLNGQVILDKWATPNTMDYMETRSAEGVEKIASGARKGRKRPSNLREQVDKKTCDIYKEQNWPTPRAGNPGSRKPGTGGKILAEEAKKSWSTPLEDDSSNVNPNAKRRTSLVKEVKHNGPPAPEKSSTSGKNHGSWPTPRVGGHEKAETSIKRGRGVSLTGAVAKDATQTPKLNPNWVEQLMGLPVGWTQLPTEWIA